MNKVYIITYGIYSDYSICAVFSTLDKAEEYIQQHGNTFRIEEHLLDEAVEQSEIWSVEIGISTHKVKLCESVSDSWHNDKVDKFRVFEPVLSSDEWSIKIVLRADSMNRAIKVANERVAQIVANKDLFYSSAFCKVEWGIFGIRDYPWVDYNTGKINEL
jgi:uncharacterized protein YaaW (UPF0174 family)